MMALFLLIGYSFCMPLSFVQWVIFASALLNIILGILVFLRRRESLVHKTFFVFSLAAFLWAVGFVFLLATENFIFDKLVLFGAILGTASLYIFSKHFPNTYKQKLAGKFWLDLSPLVFLVLILPYNLIIRGVSFTGGQVIPDNGLFFPIFVLTLGAYFVAVLINLFKSFKKADPIEKNKLYFFILGLFLFVCGVVIFDLVLPGLGSPAFNQLGPALLSVLVIATSYSLLSRKLMDVRLVIQNTVIYTVMLSLITLLYLVLVFSIQKYLGMNTDSLVIFSGLLTAIGGIILFPFFDKKLRRLTDGWLFKDKYDYSAGLLGITRRISEAHDLEEILNTSISDLSEMFRAKSCNFLMADIYSGSVSQEPLFNKLQKQVFVPVVSKEVFIATLAMGPKKSGDSYSKPDADFLQTFSYYLSSRLRQAQLVKQLSKKSMSLENELRDSEDNIERLKENQNRMIIDIAHNLQTPLAILKGEVHTLVDSQGDFATGDLDTLNNSVDRLSQFITRLLQAGDVREHRYCLQRVNLSNHLGEIVEYLHTIAHAQGIEFSSRIEPDVYFEVDTKAIEELLLNLVSNAMKYRRKDVQHRIFLSLDSGNKFIELKVYDNGVGINEIQVEKIFERWYQGNSLKKGSGLGLAIVKRIADAHGAEIFVKSKQGKESLFNVRFLKKR